MTGAFVAAAADVTEPDLGRWVAFSGVAAVALAAVASVHRSWARLPLVVVALVGGLLIRDSVIDDYDPSEMSVVGYVVYHVYLAVAAGSALAVLLLRRQR